MNPTSERQCAACGARTTSTDPADACPACGKVDWRQPRAADIIDDNDEEVVENAAAVETPDGRS